MTNPRIPPEAAALLHKKYERPKNRTEMFRLQEANARKAKLQAERQQREQRSKWLVQHGREEDDGHDDNDKPKRYSAPPKNPKHVQQHQQQQPQQHALAVDGHMLTAVPTGNASSPPSPFSATVTDVTPIQRLPFNHLSDILVDDSNTLDGEGGDTAPFNESGHDKRRRDEEVRRLLASASGRSTVHRTWKAVEDEQEHEKRTRAIKRTFLTARSTPPNPMYNPHSGDERKRKQPRPSAHLLNDDDDDDRKWKETNRSASDGNRPPAPNRNAPPRPLFSSRGAALLPPFNSRVMRLERQMENTRHTEAAKRQSAWIGAIDDDEQAEAEIRAKARFMAEVLKRRQTDDSAVVDEQERERLKRNVAQGEKKKKQRQQLPATSPTSPAAKRRAVPRFSHDSELLGALSPVGVVAKALSGAERNGGTDDEEDDDDDDDESYGDGGEDSAGAAQRQGREISAVWGDDSGNVRKAKYLWQFADRQKQPHGSGSHGFDALQEQNDALVRLEGARAKMRIAALFGRQPPADAVALVQQLENENGNTIEPVVVNIGGDDISALTGSYQGGRREFATRNKPSAGPEDDQEEFTASGGGPFHRINRQRISDILNDIDVNHRGPDLEYVDPATSSGDGVTGGGDRQAVKRRLTAEEEASARRKRAAAWRRRAANLHVESRVGHELAEQYWQMRGRYVELEGQQFEASESATNSLRSSPSPEARPSRESFLHFENMQQPLASSFSRPPAGSGGGCGGISVPAVAAPSSALQQIINSRKMAEQTMSMRGNQQNHPSDLSSSTTFPASSSSFATSSSPSLSFRFKYQ